MDRRCTPPAVIVVSPSRPVTWSLSVLIVTFSERPEAACANACRAEAFLWHRDPLAAGGRALAQVRYRQRAVPATLESVEDGGAAVRVRFDEPVFGVTPGQSLVLYDGDLVLGGGRITGT